MKKMIPLLVLWMLSAAYPAFSSTYYVSPTGNDTTGNGSIGNPWKTITKAVTAAVAGDTIYLRGGTHIYTTTITISKSGSSGARFYLFAYASERPVLDFSAMAEDSSNRGIQLNASYWYIKGIDFYKAGDNGMIIEKNLASYNIIELCNFYENRDTGLQLANGAHHNEIINCDSYYNCDAGQGNADGFAPKLTLGNGNYFYGCRAWQNSDDAYDCYLNAPTNNVTTTFENCWAFKAGYLKDGSAGSGNGNGFKMGSSTNHHNVILINCLAFSNLKKGFDQNHNKGSMTLYNCTAFNNGGNNFSIYDAVDSGYTATVTNSVNFTGGINLGAFVVQTTNSWIAPFVVDSTDFVSIDPSAAYGPRNADGSLPDITFMHLAAGSDLIDGGTDVGMPYNGSAPDLGCFETEGGSPPGQASNPVPSNGATNVIITQDLSWTAGSGAASHDVYFGTAASPPFVVNQTGTTFDTGIMASLATYYWRIDERNESGTTAGTIWSFTTQDTEAPLPDPMEWAIEPNAISSSAITMTAATASDVSGVEYYFANLTDPNHDSGWQDGTVYTDTNLLPNTTYSYQVAARDKSLNHNETGWSGAAIATTFAYDCISPITSDLDGDCEVDFFDYTLLAEAWAGNLSVIAQFATDWLTCNRVPESECWQ